MGCSKGGTSGDSSWLAHSSSSATTPPPPGPPLGKALTTRAPHHPPSPPRETHLASLFGQLPGLRARAQRNGSPSQYATRFPRGSHLPTAQYSHHQREPLLQVAPRLCTGGSKGLTASFLPSSSATLTPLSEKPTPTPLLPPSMSLSHLLNHGSGPGTPGSTGTDSVAGTPAASGFGLTSRVRSHKKRPSRAAAAFLVDDDPDGLARRVRPLPLTFHGDEADTGPPPVVPSIDSPEALRR